MTGIPDAETARDRDTLTDAEMALSFTVAGDDQFHDQLFDAETVAHIVAARVRAAQAQAWEEGLGVGTGMARIYGHTDHWPEVEPANPYSDAGDEFQNPED